VVDLRAELFGLWQRGEALLAAPDAQTMRTAINRAARRSQRGRHHRAPGDLSEAVEKIEFFFLQGKMVASESFRYLWIVYLGDAGDTGMMLDVLCDFIQFVKAFR